MQQQSIETPFPAAAAETAPPPPELQNPNYIPPATSAQSKVAVSYATSAAAFKQFPNAQNWPNPFASGVAPNGSEHFVTAQVNLISSETKIPKKQKIPERCEVCKIECNSKEILDLHKQGKKHKMNLEKLKSSLSPETSSVPIQPERCEVCNIECNSKEILDSHKQGKKHKMNLDKLKSALSSEPSSVAPVEPINPIIGPEEKPKERKAKASEPEDLELKKKKVVESGTVVDAVKTCEVCDVVCNSELVFRIHLSGKKHKKNVEKSKASLSPAPSLAPSPAPVDLVMAKDLIIGPEKTCEVCDIVCNSEVVFRAHLAGKKHKNNLEKSKASLSSAPVDSVVSNDSIIGPEKKPKKRKANTNEPEELESKKRRIVEGGTAMDEVRMCELCNVVCNSELVYKYHLAGKNHLAMTRKCGIGYLKYHFAAA